MSTKPDVEGFNVYEKNAQSTAASNVAEKSGTRAHHQANMAKEQKLSGAAAVLDQIAFGSLIGGKPKLPVMKRVEINKGGGKLGMSLAGPSGDPADPRVGWYC